MSVNTFQFDLGRLKTDLEAMGERGPIILARALNRANVAGKTAMVKAVAADLGVPQKFVNEKIRIDKATKTTPVASVEISGKRIPLIAFQAKGPEPSRGRGRGVTYKLPGSPGRIPNAFIATMRSGHRGVYVGKRPAAKRAGKPRSSPALPIFERFGPSLPGVAEKKLSVFQAAAQESLIKNLTHELDFARRPSAGSDVGPAA